MEELIALAIYIALFIGISGLVMIATNILYDLTAALIPIIAVIVIVVSILMGFFVALKNTVTAYRKVYGKGK